MAMAAGLATLRFIQSRDLFEHVRRIGRRFEERLSELMCMHSFVGDVRGRGLMLGMEIVNPEEQDSFGSPRGTAIWRCGLRPNASGAG